MNVQLIIFLSFASVIAILIMLMWSTDIFLQKILPERKVFMCVVAMSIQADEKGFTVTTPKGGYFRIEVCRTPLTAYEIEDLGRVVWWGRTARYLNKVRRGYKRGIKSKYEIRFGIPDNKEFYTKGEIK